MQEHNADGMDMEAVYRDYADLIYRFLYSHTHDAQWSQELMQETFLRAVGSSSRYDARASFPYGFVRLPSMFYGRSCAKRAG